MTTTGSLPFTVLDEAVHLLDTPSEPWTVQLELTLDGRLDAERLRAAVHAALEQHPMARARQRPARRTDRRWRWELPDAPDVDPLTVVDCEDGTAPTATRAELYSRPVPLVESPPIRFRLARHPGGDVVMVSSNHAAFDGFGALRVVHSVARAYAGRPDPPPPVALDQARDVAAHLATADRSERAERRRALADKVADLVRPPARLAPEGGADRPGYGVHHVTAPAPGPRAGGTVNDLLMAALHLAVDGWNAEHGADRRRIGVLMPVNLRPARWRDDVVTNYVLESRIATTTRDRMTPQSCLDAVAAQSRRIKEGRAAALMEVLPRLGRVPRWAKQALSPLLWLTGNRLVDTAVLSNLGRLDEVPSFGREVGATTGVWFSAPARMPCGLSLGVVTMDDRVHLAFRYRHPLWGSQAAARFAERYLVELGVVSRETAGR